MEKMTELNKHKAQIRSLQGETWLFWYDDKHSPPLNMALDEALLALAQRNNVPIVRFYGWDRPAVSIGYVQNYSAGEREDWAIVRRPTGGGVVLHDHDFTYTAILPAGHCLTQTDRVTSYGCVNSAVVAGLAKLDINAQLSDDSIPSSVARESMACFTNPTKYDVMLNNRKIAGSAQRRTRQGILHQGSIHFGGEMPCPREEMAEKLTQGFVETLGIISRSYSPPPSVFSQARELVDSKYGLDEWNKKRP